MEFGREPEYVKIDIAILSKSQIETLDLKNTTIENNKVNRQVENKLKEVVQNEAQKAKG